MENRRSSCRGALLGLAVGDAMGQTVDECTWQEIQESYGPNGLLGYDIVNDCASGSSYTQTAAYAANGLLLSVTRGRPELTPRYIALSLREWYRSQHFPRDPERSWCWVAKLPQMRTRRCKDSRMLDALRMDVLGTPEKPVNRTATPGALPVAVAVGLACGGQCMERSLAMRLGVQATALTHGDPETILCGGVTAEAIAAISEQPDTPLSEVFSAAIRKMQARFSEDVPKAEALAKYLTDTVQAAAMPMEDPRAQMEALGCDTAVQCLCGAMIACLRYPDDFDSAMILSVNHSGRSAAVGCLTGAFLGARMGAEALPEFYLECLEPADILAELADDLALGTSASGIFDADWDKKYTQGIPL